MKPVYHEWAPGKAEERESGGRPLSVLVFVLAKAIGRCLKNEGEKPSVRTSFPLFSSLWFSLCPPCLFPELRFHETGLLTKLNINDIINNKYYY
jgi:hypothetical protein